MAIDHFVIVGLGSIGQRHLKNLRSLYPTAIITIVRRSGASRLLIENLANNVVSSITDAIMIGKPTAGIIASPAPFHITDALMFVENECPVFIEKPLSNNLDGVDDLIKKSKKNNTICLVAYILRFLPLMERIKKIIQSKQYGDIITASVSVGQYLPDWRPDQDYKTTVSAQKGLGGGALLELSHELDYLLHLFGLPDRVSSIIQSSGQLDIEVEDQVDGCFYYDSGTVVHIHLNFLQKVVSRICTITFNDAYLRWDLKNGHISIDDVDGNSLTEEVPTVSNETYIDELKHFFQCIDDQTNPIVELSSGKNVLKVIEAMKIASSTDTITNVVQIESRDK